MPPKKNIEKARVNPVQVKAVKAIRKKTNSAAAPVKRILKIAPNAHMSPSVNDDQITQNASPKKGQRANLRKKKVDLNTSNGLPVVDTQTNVVLSPKPKTKNAPKANKNDMKTTPANEGLPVVDTQPSVVLSPKPKTKTGPKANKNDTKTTPTNEEFIVNQNDMPVILSPRGKAKTNPKQFSSEIKIALANEVIWSAFLKKPTKDCNVEINNSASCEGRRTSKRGVRPKKTTQKLLDYVGYSNLEPTNALENLEPAKALENNEHIQDVAKKKLVKVSGKKRPITEVTPSGDSQAQTQLDITADDSITEEVPKKKKRLSLKRKVKQNLPAESKTRTNMSNKNSKDENAETIIDASEVNANTLAQKNSPEVNGQMLEKAATCSGRKNSITSTSSCFSWTKDISSSSAVTCVTVQSHDVVRIDAKMPMVKLVKIDRQLKDTDDNIFDEVSSEKNRKRKPSECSSTTSTVDLRNLPALNLSTSTLTSVTTNISSQDKVVSEKDRNNKNVVKKLRQSLDSLSSKMKNFDLEIINWIGYENEIKDEATLNYHARIFEVLKEENEIIKYCKEIKKVLLRDVDQHSELPENENNKTETTEVKEDELHPSSKVTPSKTNYEKEADPNIGDKDIFVHKDVVLEKDKASSAFLSPSDCSQLKDKKKLESRNENDPNRTTLSSSDRPETSNNSKSVQKESNNPQIDHNDDDDAISLYAESITCWETSKRSSVNANHSVDAIDHRFHNSSPEIQNSPSNERVCHTPDDYDAYSIESGEYVDSPLRNPIKERTKTTNLYNRISDRTIFNEPNAREKSPVSPSNIQGPSDTFNATDTHKSDNALSEFMRKFEKFKKNHMPNTSLNLARRFTDLKNVQVKVPVNSEGSGGRRFEIIENTAIAVQNSSGNTTEKLNRLHDTATRPLVNGPEIWNSQTNDITDCVDRATIENSNFQSIAEQCKGQSPYITPNKQFQNRGSILFNGCYYNFVSSCKKKNSCPFPHVTFEADALTAMLQKLNKQLFTRECFHISTWYILMRKYGLCFVQECVRRKLTNQLLRIIVDFVSKVRQKDIVVQATETTLLYLNHVDLKPCYEILQCGVSRDMLLCDYFMKVLSETQNFSRFKSVFIKLTIFISEIKRTIDLEVASQLLERVSILGYDSYLAAALIQIVENTDPQIFAVSMMSSFEKKLSTNNLDLYEQLIGLKMQTGMGTTLSPRQLSPCIAPTATQSSAAMGRVDSPSISKDSMSNNSEPIITRTVTVNRLDNMASSDSSEEVKKRNYKQTAMKQNWRTPSPGYGTMRQRLQHSWNPPRTHKAHCLRLRRKSPSGC